MASIPFVGPPNIEQSVARPAAPVAETPLSLAEGVQRVQQMQQQNALAPLQAQGLQANVQTSQLQAKQLQQQLEDQQTFGQAMKNSGGDPDKLQAATAGIRDPTIAS